MTQEKRTVQYGTPAVGDGNRLVLDVIAHQLKGDFSLINTSQTISSIPARIWHARMTKSEKGYNESLRDSPLSAMLGCMLALEGALRRGKNQAKIGIFTQEMQLSLLALFPQLTTHFYDQIYLLIPDVSPKHNAIAIMKKLKDVVVPVVWNTHAKSQLDKLDLNPILTAPFLTTLTPQEILKSQAYQPRYSVIRGSGSGLADNLRTLAHMLRNPKIPNLEITSDNATWTLPNGQKRAYSRGQLADIPRDIALASEVYIYPNELTALLIHQISHGWLGLINIFEPRGSHEENNLKFLSQLGYPYRIIYKNGRVQQIMPQRSPQSSAIIGQELIGKNNPALAIKEHVFRQY